MLLEIKVSFTNRIRIFFFKNKTIRINNWIPSSQSPTPGIEPELPVSVNGNRGR